VTAGEAWTREVLRELRARRYRPRAWARFLTQSFARARATRAKRRREHRQTLLVGAAGLAAWAAVVCVRPWLALAGAVWWLFVIAMVDWHLGMLEDVAGRPLRRLGLANRLSIGRAAVVPTLFIAPPSLLAAILILAGVTDGIDGPLARIRGEATRLGVWLDGGVDAIVLSAAAVGAARHDLLPWWAVALVLGRHALQALAVALAYFLRAEPPDRSGFVSGKAPGLVLFAGLALSALGLPAGVVLVAIGAVGGAVTLAASLVRSQRLEAAA
jgi:phosphatidylglycerophosphate synthase